MGLDLIRWKANERVGLPDQDAMSDLVLEEMIRSNRDMILPDGLEPVIFDGFDLIGFTPTVSSTAQLNYGRGIMKLQKDQELHHGFLLGLQYPLNYTLDFTLAGNDTYNVYVRAVYTDATFENRVFWNPGTGSEFVDYTSTRRVVTWETTYISSTGAAPGAEWMLVHQVVVTGGVIQSTVDKRIMFFEGRPEGNYPQDWGDGADDRNVDRQAYGVKEFSTWANAVRRQLSDIIGTPAGTSHWWFQVPSIELESLALEHYSEADSLTHAGKHKQVTFGGIVTPNFWVLGSGSANAFSVLGQDQADSAALLCDFNDITGLSYVDYLTRGLGNEMTNGDVHHRMVGDVSGTLDFDEQYKRVGATEHRKDIYMAGNWAFEMSNGAAVALPGFHAREGVITSKDGFRLFAPRQCQSLIVPLQYLVTDGGVSWVHDQGGGAFENNATRLNSQSIASATCQHEITLPHNAVINSIFVLWAQTSTTAQDLRLYAQKHRIGTLSLGAVGGGTGAPSTFVNLKATNNYIQIGILGSSPHRELSWFDCSSAAAASRTFDATQDKLIITLLAPNSTIDASVYWISVNYDLDYVTPPLV